MLPYLEVFGHSIPMYAVCIMTGLAVGMVPALFRAGRYGQKKEDVLYTSFYGVLGLIAGGKLLYLLTILPFLIENFGKIIKSREMAAALMNGGFVFYGGLLGALGGMWIYARQYHMDFWRLVEVLVPSIPLIHAFGRMGCFCAGCCYGREFPEPVGVLFSRSQIALNDVALFPVQLVEAAGNLVIFLILLLAAGKRRTNGRLTAVYFCSYSLMRFFLEYMRADADRGIFWGLSTSQWISIGVFLAGILIWKKRPSENE